jgi:gamma-glutamylcyclotransferase (GGCT)/AIG2-like uncharacterized protein YtfP
VIEAYSGQFARHFADQTETLPFFVYGTLRVGQPNYCRILSGHVTSNMPAVLHNADLYALPQYPVIVPGAGTVCGELITVDDHPRFLTILDWLEGYEPRTDSGYYRRVVRDVITEQGGTVRAWVYIGAKLLHSALYTRRILISDGDWVSYLQTDQRIKSESRVES